MRKRVLLALLVVFTLVSAALAPSCGGESGNNVDGSVDGTLFGEGGGNDGSWNGDGNCQPLGLTCNNNSECCTGDCLNGACQPPACVSDNQACSASTDCCSGTCGNGKCVPLNTTCETLGNSCATSSQCCSLFCEDGICAQSSYCGQNGDICTTGTDCCGGVCNKSPTTATFGTCGTPASIGAQCQMIDGVVCSGQGPDGGVVYVDGGVPLCGGGCCSRSCAPWGPTGVLICQPASGCHPVGDVCTSNAECCGGFGSNPTVQCNKASPTDTLGVCSNPTGCKPNGDICRLQTNQCNATDECCSGNVQQDDTCHQDALGVPRCSYPGDAGCIPVGADAGCSSSADCCNLNPCVPNGDAGFTCYPQACVPVSGACTTDSDCCPGGHCIDGTCHGLTDAGIGDSGCFGAGYGQLCTMSSDCCNSVPCTNGRCEYPQPN
jgi:hypothetical protein